MSAPPFDHPETAPPRTDLPWLTVRRRAAPQADPVAREAPSAAPRPVEPRPIASPEIAGAGTSLVLGGLETSVPAAPAAGAPVPRPASARPPRLPERPLSAEGTVLTAADPVARLSRPQSGIGAVSVALRVGGLGARLGALWQAADGRVGQVRSWDSPMVRPAADRPHPVLLGAGEGLLLLDARRIRLLRRACVYVSAAAPVAWAGMLTVSTLGGSSAVVPLDAAPSAGVLPLCTLVVLDGRLYVRAERPWPVASVRDLAYEFGFDSLVWVDPNTVG